MNATRLIFLRILIGIALFVLPFSLVARVSAATNLIPNPGLETVAGSVPQDWTKIYWGSPIPTFQYPVTGRTGNGASITLGANSSGDARFAHIPTPVEAGAKYDYSNWYKSNAATEINIVYTHTDGHLSYGWVTALPSSANAWKQAIAVITVPAGVKEMTVFHLIDKKGTLVVDDFSLTKQGSEPTPTQPTLTLTASPATIAGGQSSTLMWDAQNATSCNASGGWTGTKVISGNQGVSPTVTTTYTLACTGAGGSVQKSATITVSSTPPPPPSGTFAEGMVTISFDDAWVSHYTQALPILESAGLKGTFYILTEPVQGGWSGYMSSTQVKGIAQKGHDVQGHTVTHTELTTLSSRRIDREVQDSKKYLEGLIGTPITSLAYPYGSYNTTVINRTKLAGYTSARTADPTIAMGFNSGTQPRYEINSFSPNTAVSVANIKAAIDQAKANKQWFVLSYHQIENGSSDEYTTSVANFQEIVNYIKSSGIKVVTMKEGAALLK